MLHIHYSPVYPKTDSNTQFKLDNPKITITTQIRTNQTAHHLKSGDFRTRVHEQKEAIDRESRSRAVSLARINHAPVSPTPGPRVNYAHHPLRPNQRRPVINPCTYLKSNFEFTRNWVAVGSPSFSSQTDSNFMPLTTCAERAGRFSAGAC